MSVLLFLNRHGDLVLKRGGGVALQLEAIPGEGVEIPDGGVQGEAGRRGAGVLPQQLFDNGNVPVIDVGVGDDVDQLARLSPETWANMWTSTAYCTTFQLLAASMSWDRWFRMAFSVRPETLKVME